MFQGGGFEAALLPKASAVMRPFGAAEIRATTNPFLSPMSSMCWDIVLDSRTTLSSWIKLGTTPLGLIFKYSGLRCSRLALKSAESNS